MYCRKILLAAIIGVFTLTSCEKMDQVIGKKELTCSSDASVNVVIDIIKDYAERQLIAEKNRGGEQLFLSSDIRSSIGQVKISLNSIRTTKTDPNSTKKYCEAELKFVFPMSMLYDAEGVSSEKIVQNLERNAGFVRSADAFTKNISYSVQPTDDKKEIYGEVESVKTITQPIYWIAGLSLNKPIIEQQKMAEAAARMAEDARIKAEQDRLEAEDNARRQEIAKLELQQSEARLSQVQVVHDNAEKEINATWKSLDGAVRSQLLGAQRAWIKEMTAKCQLEGLNNSGNEIDKKISELSCVTQEHHKRNKYLQGFIIP